VLQVRDDGAQTPGRPRMHHWETAWSLLRRRGQFLLGSERGEAVAGAKYKLTGPSVTRDQIPIFVLLCAKEHNRPAAPIAPEQCARFVDCGNHGIHEGAGVLRIAGYFDAKNSAMLMRKPHVAAIANYAWTP